MFVYVWRGEGVGLVWGYRLVEESWERKKECYGRNKRACVCVCVSTSLHVHLCVCVYASLYVWVSIDVCVCTSVCVKQRMAEKPHR